MNFNALPAEKALLRSSYRQLPGKRINYKLSNLVFTVISFVPTEATCLDDVFLVSR